MKIEVPENMSVVRQSLLTGKTSVIKGRSAIRIMPWQLHLLVSLDGLRFTIQHEGLLTGDIVRSSATTTVVLRVNSDEPSILRAARLVSWDETLNVAKASCLFEDRVTASVRTLAARCETREQLQLLAGEISLLVQTRCKDDFAIHGLTLESIELQIGEETYRPKFKKGDQVRLRPSVSLERPNPLIEDRRAYCEDDLDKVWTILGFNFQVPAGYSVDEGKNILEPDLELVRSERCSALPDEESSAAPISD